MTFDSLGLSAELLRGVAAQGYTCPTAIQTRAIPEVLAGRDVMARAQTGTGKTAAFTLPMVQMLAAGRCGLRSPRALVLTPTRELAAQVQDSVHAYSGTLPIRSTVIFGGVGMQPQVDRLRRGVDIVVATPGRLLDHARQRTVDLGHIEFLVLDEADRMLDMGFIHDIRRVLELLPKKRQNLLFSATYSDDISRLADRFLNDPVRVEVAPRNSAAETVTQVAHPVEKSRKRELLSQLIRDGNWSQVLVFTRTKHGANRLAEQLGRDGIDAAAIHGNKSQSARTRALGGFKDGTVRVLVATDIAARGLDIDSLPHVVNFELPNVPEDYVHRIGRTGRAGAEGSAVSLVSADEDKYLAAIQRVLKRDIPVREIAGFDRAEADRNAEPDARQGRRPDGGRGSRGHERNSRDRKPHAPRGGDGRSSRQGDERSARRDNRPTAGRGGRPGKRTERNGNSRGARTG